MDSKSIARKGVGVRFPSLVPPLAATRLARELAADLFPAVARALGGAHREVEKLGRVLARCELGEEDGSPARIAVEDAALSSLDLNYDAAERLGFVVGCLGAALGANLLGTRRVPDGMARMGEALELALGEGGFALDPPASALPELRASVGEGWEVPLLVASLLRHAKRRQGVVSWTLESSGERCRLWTALPRTAARDLIESAHAFDRDQLCGITLEVDEDGAALAFPSSWLVLQ